MVSENQTIEPILLRPPPPPRAVSTDVFILKINASIVATRKNEAVPTKWVF